LPQQCLVQHVTGQHAAVGRDWGWQLAGIAQQQRQGDVVTAREGADDPLRHLSACAQYQYLFHRYRFRHGTLPCRKLQAFFDERNTARSKKRQKRSMSASPSPCPAVDCCPCNFNEIRRLPAMLNEKSQHRRSNQESRMTRSHPRLAFLFAHCRCCLSLLDLSRVPLAELRQETIPQPLRESSSLPRPAPGALAYTIPAHRKTGTGMAGIAHPKGKVRNWYCDLAQRIKPVDYHLQCLHSEKSDGDKPARP
jgi:hypothetical protein